MKAVSLSRRLLAIILCFVLCCTYLPATAAAADTDALYGIAANDGTTITELYELDDESVLDAFSEEAALLNYGIEAKIVNWTIQFEKTGQYVSPFSMKATGSNGIASFTMDRPEFNSKLEQAGLKGTYKIAVQDASSSTAPVLFLPTTEDSGKLNVSIPISASGVNCALFYVLPDDVQVITVDEPISAETPSSIYENSAGSPFSVEWTTKLKFNDAQGVHLYPDTSLHGSVILKAPTGITFNAKSVSVESDFLEITEIIPQNDGSILVNLGETSEFSELEFAARDEMINTDISISCDAYLDSDAFIAEGTISMPYVQLSIGSKAYNEGEPQPPLYFAISVISDIDRTSTMKSAVTITPADLTIYQGGDGGYDAVVDGSGNIVSDTNSLPHPLFKITAPSDTSIDPADLTFTNEDESKSWKVKGTEDPDLYYFESVGAQQDPVRVTYTNSEGTAVTSDEFDVTTVKDTYAEFTIDLYPGENDFSKITASADNGTTTYPISVNSGTLTVRAVADKTDPTSDVEKTAPTTKVDAGKATAVEPEGGTTYTLNDTEVALPTDGTAKPSLLFDDIIEDENSTERTEALKAAADKELGSADANRRYEIKYLDLVDANNGNAWITSSKGTDIYWGYPEGTSQSTEFTLLHFEGLHRDGQNSGYEVSDINSATVEPVDNVEKTANGIKFHVGAGGFSPFALVWTESTGGGGGGTTYYTITATADDGGSIDPSGSVRVASGRDKTFTITADEGYEIADVLVDGESVGAVSEYTFENVRKKHTIEARFEATGEIPVKDPDETGVSDWLNTDDHIAYMSGYPEGDFRPDVDMTRAEAAQMFYNLLLDKDTAAEASFSDVPANAWYAEAVNALASIGVIEGIGDNQYAPDRAITRAEFTAIAMRFADLETGGENIFSDVAENAWYYDYVVGSIQYGWINGYPDGTFRPENTISRVEVTTIVNRMLGRSADENFVDSHADELRQFTDVNDSHWGYYNIMEAANAHDFTMENNTENWTALR